MVDMLFALFLFAAAVAEWNQPVEPVRIAGNLYSVGANEITSFLIATPQGHILLDGGFEETAPQILANVRKLGFDPKDVKVLLNSQAHYDHAGGFAALKKATGAKLEVMDGDAQQIERGGLKDFAFGDRYPFPPARVDRVLHDGDTVSLGGTTMTAVLTPGHTRGCTTWTMTAGGKRVVFVCSTTAPGYDLRGPIVEEFRATFRRLPALPCDIFLASHASFFNPAHRNDSETYRRFIARTKAAFEEQLRTSPSGAALPPAPAPQSAAAPRGSPKR